jgi:long-chain acyl-CoA synthetase
MAALKRQQRLLPMSDADERVLFMPLSIGHERMSMYQCMYIGAKMNFIESQDTVIENLREVSPTVSSAAPRVWESQRASVLAASRESGRVQQAMLRWGFAIGRSLADRRTARGGLDVRSWLLLRLADLVVLGRVKSYLGLRRARFVVSTGAPIDPVIVQWFLDLGVPMIEAWGSAETAGLVTATSANSIRPGSVGLPATGDEVRIDAVSGEILIRGDAMLAKYLDDGYRTASVHRPDGWVATGDAGALDASGRLSISSRLWDRVATTSGTLMTVSAVEDELRRSPYVADVVVLGRVAAPLTAMIMLDREVVERYAQEHLLPASGYAALILAPELRQVIQDEIDAVNAKVGDTLAIGHYVVLETQPGVDDEDLTPAMRLRREPVQEKFAGQKFAEKTDAIRP